MDVRYQGTPIEGGNGLWMKRQVEVRQIHPHLKGDVARALNGNNLDEIVAKNARGDQFVIFADELTCPKGFPAVGDTISLEGHPLTVVRVDDEAAEKRIGTGVAVTAVAVGAAVGAKFGVGPLAKGGTGWVLGKLGLGNQAIHAIMGGVTGFGVVKGAGQLFGVFGTNPTELYRISSPL